MNYALTDQMEFWSVPGFNIVQRVEFNLDVLVNPSRSSSKALPPALGIDRFSTNFIKLFCEKTKLNRFTVLDTNGGLQAIGAVHILHQTTRNISLLLDCRCDAYTELRALPAF